MALKWFFWSLKSLPLNKVVKKKSAHLLNWTTNKISFHPSANSPSIANHLIMWDVSKQAIHKEHVNFRHLSLGIRVNFIFKPWIVPSIFCQLWPNKIRCSHQSSIFLGFFVLGPINIRFINKDCKHLANCSKNNVFLEIWFTCGQLQTFCSC